MNYTFHQALYTISLCFQEILWDSPSFIMTFQSIFILDKQNPWSSCSYYNAMFA